MRKKILIFILFLLARESVISQNIISGIEGQSTYFELSEDMQTVFPKLSIYNSGGSIENILKLVNDSTNIDMAFLQYDVLLNYQIRNPKIKESIEIIFPMYNEEVHLIAKRSSGIASIKDLQGRKVAIGSKSQGTNITAKSIISLFNVKCKMINISYRDAFAALLDDKIDAFFYVGGVPIKNLSSFPKEISGIIKLVPIESELLNGIYEKATIKKDKYPWLNEDIETVSVKSYVVYNKNKDNKDFNVNNLINIININLKKFKSNTSYHPKWQEIDLQTEKLPDWPINKRLLSILKINNNEKN